VVFCVHSVFPLIGWLPEILNLESPLAARAALPAEDLASTLKIVSLPYGKDSNSFGVGGAKLRDFR
jgi:hypothetical protein